MTKWNSMSKRKARKRSKDEGKEVQLTQPEKISEGIQHSQETEKSEYIKTSKPKTILAQIPRYGYLLAFFVFLSGIFAPLIHPSGHYSLGLSIGGTATLFLGLVGGILLFKATTSDNRRVIFIVSGFASISISLALIYMFQEGGPNWYF